MSWGRVSVRARRFSCVEQQPQVDIVRSARRRTTVSASLVDGTVVVRVPARISQTELDRIVPGLVRRVLAKQHRAAASDETLMERARLLSRRYLDACAVPESVRWVTNQQQRWGSCTPSSRQIRLSHRLQGMPQYVLDYVLVHELAHLLHADHGPDFTALVGRYPQVERAQAYLDGVSFGAGLPAMSVDDPSAEGRESG